MEDQCGLEKPVLPRGRKAFLPALSKGAWAVVSRGLAWEWLTPGQECGDGWPHWGGTLDLTTSESPSNTQILWHDDSKSRELRMAEVGGGVTEGTICQEVHSGGSYWTGQKVQLEVAGHAGLLRIPRRLKVL